MGGAAGGAVVGSPLELDIVCRRARRAAVALGLVPHGVMLVFWGVGPPALTGRWTWLDVVSGIEGTAILTGCLYLVGRGVIAMWRDSSAALGGGRPSRRVWAAFMASVVALGVVFPPLLVFSTLWLWASVALTLRVIDWEHDVRRPSDLGEWRRRRLAWTLSLVLISHVLAWAVTLAHAHVVTDEEFARVDAIRAGTVTKTEFEDWPVDAYNLMMSGTAVAGRWVLGDMSFTQFTIGYWPLWAHQLVVPDGEQSPTRRESYVIAVVALAMSLAAWSAVVGAFAYWPVGWGRSAAASIGTATDPPDRG